MDLLALATADGQLHVHRLNWQRLWWTSPDAPITALEWRPDGKQLAVGLEDGTVLLLSTEDGEVQHKACILPDTALVAITWTESAAAAQPAPTAAAHSAGLTGSLDAPATSGSQLAEDRARRMFSPPPAPQPAASAGLAVGYSTLGKHSTCSQAWPTEQPRLAVLACASAAGDLVLCTSRLFTLGLLHMPTLLGRPQVSVLRLATAPSLQQLVVCWHGAADALHLSAIDMHHVGRHATQLHRLAIEAAHVGALLEGCQHTYQAVCKEWQAAMRECRDDRTRLAALMSDYGTTGQPASELQNLLATGAVGGALQQYITSTLGETGLKKLARAVDAAVCLVHNLLTDHLQPQLEQLAFRLGELRGLALCLPWRRITGLQPEQVGAAEQLALRLVLRAEAVRRQVVQAGAQYRTFFAWLLIVLRRMQEDASDVLVGYPRSHLEAVQDFLAGQYQQDALGPMLGADNNNCQPGSGNSGSNDARDVAPAAAAAAAHAAAGGGMLDLVMEVLGQQAEVQAADSTAALSQSNGGASAAGRASASSLGQLLGNLRDACLTAFERTAEVISPQLKLGSSLSLGPAPSALAASYLPDGATSAAAVAWQGQLEVLVVRGRAAAGDDGRLVGLEAAVVRLPGGNSAADLAFYKEGQLALLLAPAGGTDSGHGAGAITCRLLLLPLHRLHFVQLPSEFLANGSSALQLCQMLLESVGATCELALPEDCRQRTLAYPRVQRPMAVSASRGVGCVLAGMQRVLLFDLEEDEGDEEEEEGTEGGHTLDGGDSSCGFESPTR